MFPDSPKFPKHDMYQNDYSVSTSVVAIDSASLKPFPKPSASTGFAKSSDPQRFLPDEPMFYESEEIPGIFFKEAETEVLFNGRLKIVNESKSYTIPDTQLSSGLSSSEANFENALIASSKGSPTYFTLFISDDGDKLNYLSNNSKTNKGKPKENEIIIYIEADSDLLSKKVLHLIPSRDVRINDKPFRSIIQSIALLTDDEVKALLNSISQGETNFTENLATGFTEFFKAHEVGYGLLSSALGKIIELIEKLLIEEKYWNPSPEDDEEEESNATLNDVFNGIDALIEKLQSEINRFDTSVSLPKGMADKISVFFKNLNIALNQVGVIHKKIIGEVKDLYQLNLSLANKWYQHNLSLLIGIWNGLVDMLSGFVFLVRLPFAGGEFTSKALGAVANFHKEKKQKQSILEQLDNLIDSMQNINLEVVFDKILMEAKRFINDIDLEAIYDSIKKTLKEEVKQKLSSITSYQIFYYIGYIATLFIPFAWVAAVLGKAGKAGRLLGKAMKWVDDLMAKLFGIAIKGIKKAAQPITFLLRVITKKLNGGIKAIIKVIDEIVLGIRMWLDEIFPIWSKAVKQFNEALNKAINNKNPSSLKKLVNKLALKNKSQVKLSNELDGLYEVPMPGKHKLVKNTNGTFCVHSPIICDVSLNNSTDGILKRELFPRILDADDLDSMYVYILDLRKSRRYLRERMKPPKWADPELKHDGWNAHHVIPYEFHDHPVFLILKEKGFKWDHNALENGIALPNVKEIPNANNLPVHQIPNTKDLTNKSTFRDLAGHPVYNGKVERRLNELLDKFEHNPNKLNEEVDKLIKELREELQSGKFKYLF